VALEPGAKTHTRPGRPKLRGPGVPSPYATSGLFSGSAVRRLLAGRCCQSSSSGGKALTPIKRGAPERVSPPGVARSKPQTSRAGCRATGGLAVSRHSASLGVARRRGPWVRSAGRSKASGRGGTPASRAPFLGAEGGSQMQATPGASKIRAAERWLNGIKQRNHLDRARWNTGAASLTLLPRSGGEGRSPKASGVGGKRIRRLLTPPTPNRSPPLARTRGGRGDERPHPASSTHLPRQTLASMLQGPREIHGG
jgi:hypothetical protein